MEPEKIEKVGQSGGIVRQGDAAPQSVGESGATVRERDTGVQSVCLRATQSQWSEKWMHNFFDEDDEGSMTGVTETVVKPASTVTGVDKDPTLGIGAMSIGGRNDTVTPRGRKTTFSGRVSVPTRFHDEIQGSLRDVGVPAGRSAAASASTSPCAGASASSSPRAGASGCSRGRRGRVTSARGSAATAASSSPRAGASASSRGTRGRVTSARGSAATAASSSPRAGASACSRGTRGCVTSTVLRGANRAASSTPKKISSARKGRGVTTSPYNSNEYDSTPTGRPRTAHVRKTPKAVSAKYTAALKMLKERAHRFISSPGVENDETMSVVQAVEYLQSKDEVTSTTRNEAMKKASAELEAHRHIPNLNFLESTSPHSGHFTEYLYGVRVPLGVVSPSSGHFEQPAESTVRSTEASSTTVGPAVRLRQKRRSSGLCLTFPEFDEYETDGRQFGHKSDTSGVILAEDDYDEEEALRIALKQSKAEYKQCQRKRRKTDKSLVDSTLGANYDEEKAMKYALEQSELEYKQFEEKRQKTETYGPVSSPHPWLANMDWNDFDSGDGNGGDKGKAKAPVVILVNAELTPYRDSVIVTVS